jgi:hypothetical protein
MSYRGRSFLMLLVTSKTIEKWWHVISHSFRIARRNSRIKLVKSQKSLRFPIVWWCHGVEAWWPASWRVRSLWTRCHSVESSKRRRGGVLGWLFFRIYEIYVRIESYIIVIYVLFWKHTKTYYNGMDSYMLLYMLAYFLQCFFTLVFVRFDGKERVIGFTWGIERRFSFRICMSDLCWILRD